MVTAMPHKHSPSLIDRWRPENAATDQKNNIADSSLRSQAHSSTQASKDVPAQDPPRAPANSLADDSHRSKAPAFNTRVDWGPDVYTSGGDAFRDGVGESRFKELLATEVANIKQIFRRLNGTNAKFRVKFTVVVAEKRHHIRFFPKGGAKGGADENSNPLPGTIVDHDVTDPRGNDIYLCSHRALKGTARPTHYTMLMDEAKVPMDTFQRILYEQCYQYIRSTTAVSLHPAVYYAHLASKRARAHDISSPGDSQEKPGRLARLDMQRPETTVNQGGKPEDEWIGHVSDNSICLYRLYKQVTDLANTRGVEGTGKLFNAADNRGDECPTRIQVSEQLCSPREATVAIREAFR
ncbi:MAG: hypothetical protein LQ337_001554 [Flavoplaca oasis]|nr:MAG: hypothetical protein LQ337_001554 [Flavoplaca oasis]